MFQNCEHLNAIVHISPIIVERRKRGRPVESLRNFHITHERDVIRRKEDDRKMEIMTGIRKKEDDRKMEIMIAKNDRIMKDINAAQDEIMQIHEEQKRSYLHVGENLRGLIRDQQGRLTEFNEPEAPSMFNTATSNLSASNLSASYRPTQDTLTGVAAPVNLYDVSGCCFW